MSNNYQVKLPDGTMRNVSDNQVPYHLNCPIDGTQLAERTEYDYTGYDCVTCHTPFSTRTGRISQEKLIEQARFYLGDYRKRLEELEKEKSRLLGILELAEKNSFS